MRSPLAASLSLVVFALSACGVPAEVVLGEASNTGGVSGATGSGGVFFEPAPQPGSGCLVFEHAADETTREMQIVLDRSEAMNARLPLPGAGTWWTAAREAVSRFAVDPASAGAGVGLQVFPHASTGTDACAADYRLGAVPMGTLPENAPALFSALQVLAPAGPRSLGPALVGSVLHVVGGSPWAARHRVVALVTSGLPSRCEPSSQVDLVRFARTSHLDGRVRTHVVGLNAGGAGEALNAVATAGGTASATLIDGGNVTERLHAALHGILRSPYGCRYPAPPAPQGVQEGTLISRLKVTVRRPTEGASILVPRVPMEEHCQGDSQPGWYTETDFRGGLAVAFCPRSCTDAAQAKVSIAYGCTGAGQ